MSIQEYINEKKELYSILLQFIEDNGANNDQFFQQLTKIIDSQNLSENKKEFSRFLSLLYRIFTNHARNNFFFSKFSQIFLFLKEKLKQTFTNTELFQIFKRNNRFILLLLENDILIIDESILKFLKNPIKNLFFYPEIKNFLKEEIKQKIERQLKKYNPQIMDKFEINRSIGEKENYICQLIRNDSIEEFIIYVNETNYPLSSTLKYSLFETNLFLINKKPSLIEYAAFFGSIQIFQYLKLNKISLERSLWFYAIHSNNAEMIHILEENHIKPENNFYEKCLKEAIKCHHNQIANYILSNYVGIERNDYFIQNDYENIYTYSFHYQNYEFFPNELNSKFIFYNACHYDYFPIVKFLVENKKIDLNERII